MAAATCLLSEDWFLCPICLDVFTDPVTTSCGHNYSKNCITTHWNLSLVWKCPMCKKVFNTRPELQINTFISEMVAQFRQEAQQKASSGSSSGQQGQVPCDICTGNKAMARKSCLVCLVSYCETHLEPHLRASGLKRHPLIDPVGNVEGRMCTEHYKPLELFCKTDQTSVCELCHVLHHKSHDVVLLTEEYEEKKAELEKIDAEIQQMILKKQLKIQEIKHSVDLSKEDADGAIAEGVQAFTSLSESVERGLGELIETIEKNQNAAQKRAEDLIKELEQEISELRKRSAEIEQLSISEHHLHLLQCFPFMEAPPPTKDWTEVSVHPFYEWTVVRALAQLEETLSKKVREPLEAELRWVQQYAVDVTLDPETAHPSLILSDDGKQVNPGDVKSFPDNPERFSVNPCVLGKHGFSSGRFYFEVLVKGKTEWDLGVARESINRKEDIPLSPGDGYWTIWLRKRIKYKALTDPPVCLFLKSKLQKVGVFVDYEQGLVLFYDVVAPGLIYSFTRCSFTEKLYPYFNPGLTDGGKNSSPLVISLCQSR